MQTISAGFILTRHWRDTPRGIEVSFWLATDQGPRSVTVPLQRATAFFPTEYRSQVESLLANYQGITLHDSALKDFSQRPQTTLYLSQQRSLKAITQHFAQAAIPLYEADIRPTDRYMMERFITAPVWIEHASTKESARLKPYPDYRPTLKWVSLDIETNERGELYCLGLEGCGQRQVYMLGPPTPSEAQPDFTLTYVSHPRDLIHALNQWMAMHDPDVLIGWNVIQFDLRILHREAERFGLPLKLGRGGGLLVWQEHGFKPGVFSAQAAGRWIIDGIDALKSAFWDFPSFSLENVSQHLLGEGKDSATPHDRMAEINQRFRQDKVALARYNLKDCELVTRIFQ